MIVKVNDNGTIKTCNVPDAADIPSKTSDLTNDSGFITNATVPTATTSKSGTTTTLTVTDKNGTTTSQILDGPQGPKGDTGDSGVYVGDTAPTNGVNVWVDTSGGIDNVQTTSNLVTSISSSSTDTQYPSAKCVYDIIGNLETLLASI